MAIRTRTEFVDLKDTVQLTVTFKDTSGVPTDLDAFPTISIIQPSGLVSLSPTSQGVMQIDTGKYQYDYTIGFSPGSYGVWNDVWAGTINGFPVTATFNFVVNNTQQPQLNTDGYYHLGDEFPFNYSQTEIYNINKLLKTLRARLNSRGKSKSTDSYGNVIYVDCDIFSVDMLVTFLANSLSLFNEIPHFSLFTFADTDALNQFHEVIVEGALYVAMASRALIERGGEYNVSDSGISLTPPALSDLLNTQAGTLLTHHFEKVKFIKNSLKPYPVGLGSFSISAGNNPAFRRLRWLRQRQIL